MLSAMFRLKTALIFIIPAALIILSAVSCGDNTGSLSDYGNPPEVEKCFCNPDGVEVYLESIAESYPEITNLRESGTTADGRKIYTLELSDNPGIAENEPAVFIGGAVHGHEQASAGVSLHLIEYLVNAYPDSDDAADIIENIKLHVMPVLNPDGLDSGIRYNSNGVDLNRNFGFHWSEEEINNGDEAFDQPESAAVRDDFLAQDYSSGLILHTASSQNGIGIYGPWDAIPTDDVDFNIDNYAMIESIGENYSDTLTASAGYPYNPYFHYEEGADWYILYGSVNDWALGVTGAVCYSVELYGKQNYSTYDADLLDKIWNVHKKSIIDFIRSRPEW
ncbi:MAG TPA: hypothetical protein DCO79_11355 [Spirochaeta sp.]|nr:hypothetical protein [Spirochaeta sp.]